MPGLKLIHVGKKGPDWITEINCLWAELIWGNIKIYLHIKSLLFTEVAWKVVPGYDIYIYHHSNLWMHPANERRLYIVTSSLIGWAHAQKDPCIHAWSRSQELYIENKRSSNWQHCHHWWHHKLSFNQLRQCCQLDNLLFSMYAHDWHCFTLRLIQWLSDKHTIASAPVEQRWRIQVNISNKSTRTVEVTRQHSTIKHILGHIALLYKWTLPMTRAVFRKIVIHIYLISKSTTHSRTSSVVPFTNMD